MSRKYKNHKLVIGNSKKFWLQKKLFFMLILLCICLPISAAQTKLSPEYSTTTYDSSTFSVLKDSIQIEAKILDDNFEPLMGVSVLVKNTPYGTSSDFDGEIKMRIPSKALDRNTTLELHYIGYLTKEISLCKFLNSKENFIQILLDPDYVSEAVIIPHYPGPKRAVPLKKEKIESVLLKGRLTDESNMGLIAVAVKVERVAQVVRTDKDGYFEMEVSLKYLEENRNLMFRNIGYEDTKIPIKEFTEEATKEAEIKQVVMTPIVNDLGACE